MGRRTWVWVGIAAACVSAGIALATPSLPRRLGLDFWAVSGLRRDMDVTRRAIDRADAELAEARERIEVTEAIVAELAEGHLTLRDAAERCRDATPRAVWAAHLACLHFHHPSLTDEGCVCRNLIAGVRAGAGAEAAARLEREWHATVRDGGDVFFLTP